MSHCLVGCLAWMEVVARVEAFGEGLWIVGVTYGKVEVDANVVFKAKYDAWGEQECEINSISLRRGYTGQEEMPEFGLVNLNARLYDPMLGRFISPDNFVQCPDFSQNYNRYAYCINNPLKYNDPSGNCIGAVIASVAFTMLRSACETSMQHGDLDMFAKNFGLKMLSSAVSAVGGSIGDIFGHSVGSFWNEVLRAGAHGLFNGFMNTINDRNFLSGFAAGAVASSTGSLAQWGGMSNTGVIMLCTATGSLASGLFEGGNGSAFVDGAIIGYKIGTFNHCGGDDDDDKKKKSAQLETLEKTRNIVGGLEDFIEWNRNYYDQLDKAGYKLGTDGKLYKMPRGRFNKQNVYVSKGVKGKIPVNRINTSKLDVAGTYLRRLGYVIDAAEAGTIYKASNYRIGPEMQRFLISKACGYTCSAFFARVCGDAAAWCSGGAAIYTVPSAIIAGGAFGYTFGSNVGEKFFDTYMK